MIPEVWWLQILGHREAEWEVESGKWKVGSGKWEVESGKYEVRRRKREADNEETD